MGPFPVILLCSPVIYDGAHSSGFEDSLGLLITQSVEKSTCSAGDPGSILGRRSLEKERQPTPLSLPGKSHG